MEPPMLPFRLSDGRLPPPPPACPPSTASASALPSPPCPTSMPDESRTTQLTFSPPSLSLSSSSSSSSHLLHLVQLRLRRRQLALGREAGQRQPHSLRWQQLRCQPPRLPLLLHLLHVQVVEGVLMVGGHAVLALQLLLEEGQDGLLDVPHLPVGLLGMEQRRLLARLHEVQVDELRALLVRVQPGLVEGRERLLVLPEHVHVGQQQLLSQRTLRAVGPLGLAGVRDGVGLRESGGVGVGAGVGRGGGGWRGGEGVDEGGRG